MTAELDDAVRLGIRGVSASIGASAQVLAVPGSPDLTYITAFVNACIARGLKCNLLLSEGPPINAAWMALNNDVAWNSKNRPPPGYPESSYSLWSVLKADMQAIVTAAVAIYTAAGLDHTKWLGFRIGNEPAKGGSGGPWTTSGPFVYDAPYDALANGTIDDDWHCYATYVFATMNFGGCDVSSPSLECTSDAEYTQELATIVGGTTGRWNAGTLAGGAATDNGLWRNCVTHWAMSAYFGQGTYWKNSPKDFAKRWKAKVQARIVLLRALSMVGASAKIVIAEYGCSRTHIGMAATTWLMPKGYEHHGDYMKMMMAMGGQTGARCWSFYALTDASTSDLGDSAFSYAFYNGTTRRYRASWRRLFNRTATTDPNGLAFLVNTGLEAPV